MKTEENKRGYSKVYFERNDCRWWQVSGESAGARMPNPVTRGGFNYTNRSLILHTTPPPRQHKQTDFIKVSIVSLNE